MNPTSWLSIVVVTAAASSLADKRLSPAIRTYAVQALALGLLIVAEGWQERRGAVAAFGALILLLKGLLTPLYIQWVSRRTGTGRELEPLLNIPLSLVAAGLCVLVAVLVAATIPPPDPEDGLPLMAGLSTLLLGLLIMATRRKAITQALGLLTMENGAFLLSLVLAGELPIVVELAVLLDVLVLVVLLGILFHRIREAFDHLDASAMKTLEE